MTATDLTLLLDYHYWARDRLLDAASTLQPDALLRDMGNSFRSVRDTLVHIYGAEWVWYARWQGQSPTALPDAAAFPDVATLRAAWTALEAQVRAFVADLGEDGIAREFRYASLAGAPATSAFWQMLQHVVNHATYHRGQVTTLLRQLGARPPGGMDLIQFYRTRG